MDKLEAYHPDVQGADDNLRLQQLLDMARGIDGRTPASPDIVATELGHYAHYNGGEYGIFHVVRDDERVAAMVHSAWFAHSLQFNALAVDPEYRGIGVAKRIIVTLAHEAIARSIDDLWVYALRNSHASNVYARLGMSMPPLDDERHVSHGRYFPMTASPRAVVDRGRATPSYEIVGELPRGPH